MHRAVRQSAAGQPGNIANSVSLNESGTFAYLAADLGVIDHRT
ncbi:hypothetical protein [Mycolicibacterium peregrinum]|nr:hypothetical protein [Mycolicibacterium peregrinum]